MVDIAQTLDDASIALDGHNVLDPKHPDFAHYYVKRQEGGSKIVREAIAAQKNGRPFHWFYTGHTGAGKSTELNRLIDNDKLRKHYLPLLISISDEFDIHNIDYTDVIFAMAKACAAEADRLKCKIPPELAKRIDSWGKEIITEESIQTQTKGKAGLKISLPFLVLGEEIKSGGGKRKTIRDKIYDDITGFIHLLDSLTQALVNATGRMPLCVLDGLDHVDVGPCLQLFNNYFVTLMKPNVAKLIVVPLAILNDREFGANANKIHSTLPNIKVFAGPGSKKIDLDGLSFSKNVISKYANLDLFSDEALESLFRLSGGILRDMIRNCGDACGFADDERADKVEQEHVERIWNEQTGFFRRVLKKADYEVLRQVEGDPYPEGLDGIPPLLHLKAIIFYPNGEGWYGVHPAVQRLLDGK